MDEHISPGVHKSFIKKLMDGDFGLRTTYWTYGVAVSILVAIADYVALTVLNSAALSVFIGIASLAYAPIISIAIWNAADAYRGAKIWRILAQGIVILGVIKLLAEIVQVFNL